ncbi:MAG: hypothetical protein EOM20_06660 [Spartobacteria bacterium]|nr:hypothetical protein [Spartobacteria bacterium]
MTGIDDIQGSSAALSGYKADPARKSDPAVFRKPTDRFVASRLEQTMSDPVTYSRARVIAQYRNNQPGHGKQDIGDVLDEQELMALRKRDREVRTHEQTHAAVLGPYAGAIRYKYKIGPDGHMYADGGSIVVRTGFGGDSPAAMYHRASRMRRAAMANPSPSSADISSAVMATRMQQQAMAAKLRDE